MGQVGQHLHRQAVLIVLALGGIGQQPQLFGGRQPGGTGGDHRAKAAGDKGQHIARDLQHRRGHRSAGGKGIGHALRGRGHRVTDHGLCNKVGQKGIRRRDAANAAQTEDHRKGDAHGQQSAARAIAFFCTDADVFHRGRLRLCKDLPEPTGHPGGIVGGGAGASPALPEGLCCLPDAVVGRMDSGLANIVSPVPDLHAPALKAVAEGVGHGVAKGAQLVLQLLLHLTALVLDPVVVFTIVHQNLLTLLPVHTG